MINPTKTAQALCSFNDALIDDNTWQKKKWKLKKAQTISTFSENSLKTNYYHSFCCTHFLHGNGRTRAYISLTITWSCCSRRTKTTLWAQNVLNLPTLKFKDSMINVYFKILQITCFGGIVHLLEDRIEKLTCVCRSNFEGRIAFQHWKLTYLRALFISSRPDQDRLNMVYKKKTYKQVRFISWEL